MKNCVVLLLTLGLTVGAAEADFKAFDGAVYDVFITDPVAVGDGSEDLLSVVLRVENKTGDPGFDPSAFDGLNSGYTGITSKLHQHYWTGMVPSTPTLDSTALATEIDTHFLFVIADLLIVVAPSEDATMPSAEASPVGGDTDFGTFLTGEFAVPAAPVLDLAYIVVPAYSFVTLDFFMSGTKGGEHIWLWGPIPEPATMSLLGLGGLALLRKRRISSAVSARPRRGLWHRPAGRFV